MLETIWNNLMTAFDIYAFLVFVFYFALGVVTCYAFLRLFFRKEIRLFRNLKRKVYLLKTGTATLETEREMLNTNGLFVVNDRILDLTNDTNTLQTLEKFAVFVIGYSSSCANYQIIVDRAKASNIPVIVLAKPTEITPEHMAIFQQYIYFEMCNSPARLLTIIFNLSLITPYEKK